MSQVVIPNEHLGLNAPENRANDTDLEHRSQVPAGSLFGFERGFYHSELTLTKTVLSRQEKRSVIGTIGLTQRVQSGSRKSKTLGT
jgi:hypothetical protein